MGVAGGSSERAGGRSPELQSRSSGPLPKPIHERREGKTTVARFEGVRFRQAFARLAHNAEQREDFDRYYRDAGFVTVDNPC